MYSDSHPNPAPFLQADEIQAATFIRSVEIYDSLDSTNNCAAALARTSNLELPALVVARKQTAGRGRGINRWWSANGALTFSVLLHPAALAIDTNKWPKLSLAAAVSVCDAIRSHAPRAIVGIKWPNDVLLDGAKVGGILIESPGGGPPASERLILGVGLNVNNSCASAPREVQAEAVALCDITGQNHALQALLIAILRNLARRLDHLRHGAGELARDWQRADLLAHQQVAIDNHARRIEGTCVGIADDGALIVDTLFGPQRFYTGSVRVIRGKTVKQL